MINPRTSFVVPRTASLAPLPLRALEGGTLPGKLLSAPVLPLSGWSQARSAHRFSVGGVLGTAKEVLVPRI